ncbi:MAG: hypothetical protein HKN68_10095, partial [Saprospiraceae bacterium]|nr:hypothetical protein [Saprospiraceae bacterium]
MKPFIKAIFFLIVLTFLDFGLRKGLFAFAIPIPLPQNFMMFFMYTLFTVCGWFVTKWFCKLDKISLNDLGISFNRKNRTDFYYGFLIGFVLWAIVSIIQAMAAGFSWEFRP